MKRGSRALPADSAVHWPQPRSVAARVRRAVASPTPRGAAAQGQDSAGPSAARGAAAPRPYARVITTDGRDEGGPLQGPSRGRQAVLRDPAARSCKDILVVQRTAAGGSSSGFFGGGPSRVVEFDREGSRLLLRQKSYGIIADPRGRSRRRSTRSTTARSSPRSTSSRGVRTARRSSRRRSCSPRTSTRFASVNSAPGRPELDRVRRRSRERQRRSDADGDAAAALRVAARDRGPAPRRRARAGAS
jgi:hypothetical protein